MANFFVNRFILKHLILISFFVVACQPSIKKQEQIFAVQLLREPMHLNPQRLLGSSSSFFFFNILRGLYRIEGVDTLVPEGGECRRGKALRLHCDLFDRKWSDGSAVTASDYLRSFQNLLDPDFASPRANILSSVKKASAILKGQARIDQLGFKIIDPKKFVLELNQHDPDILYKLASTALYPLHKDFKKTSQDNRYFVGNGPYQIEQWKPGASLSLAPNPYYLQGETTRPKVIFYFIEEDMTAFRLYESGKLSFLRRVPTSLYSKIKTRKDFHKVNMARFDYIGFAGRLQSSENIRKALIYALDYKKMQELLQATGRPGCPSIPSTWIDHVPCHKKDLKKAKSFLHQASFGARKQTYQIKFSKLGGEDIQKQAEFLQAQWQEHLGLQIEIQQVEQKNLFQELRKDPPDIFRKGVGLDQPTCLHALKTFAKDSPVYRDGDRSQTLSGWIEKLKKERQVLKKKKICRLAINDLLRESRIIPMGKMHFNILVKESFTGWSLNSLNQLDLAQLRSLAPK